MRRLRFADLPFGDAAHNQKTIKESDPLIGSLIALIGSLRVFR
jgi:hypothetical protein